MQQSLHSTKRSSQHSKETIDRSELSSTCSDSDPSEEVVDDQLTAANLPMIVNNRGLDLMSCDRRTVRWLNTFHTSVDNNNKISGIKQKMLGGCK